MSGPLAGVKVIDFGQAAVGPVAAALMGQLGADVIKVEPIEGDMVRGGSYNSRLMSTTFFGNGITKRSIALNLKDEKDRRIALQLAAKADIIVENYRSADIMDRLGVGYETVSKINPRIIFLSSSAYGNSGPWKGMSSTDYYAQASSGITSINGKPGGKQEMLRGVMNHDLNAAHINASAILAALYAREKTGRGQKIYTSQWQSTVVLQTTRIAEYFATGKQPPRLGTARTTVVPDQAFPTMDGYINVSVIHDGFWPKLCRAIGREELIEDPRFETNQTRVEHREELIPILETVFRGGCSAEWLFKLSKADVPCGPCLDFMGTTGHPQMLANEYVLELESRWGPTKVAGHPWIFSKTHLGKPKPAPALNEHRQEILKEWQAAEAQ